MANSYKYPEYSVEVEYLKNGKRIKKDTPETASSKVEAKKYFARAIRLAFVEDYGQDEVWVHLMHFNTQIGFKAVKEKVSNPSNWIPCKAIRIQNGKLLIRK